MSFRQTAIYMASPVTIELVDATGEATDREAIARAFSWFERVEATCSRFDSQSELSRLTGQVGLPVVASPLLFEAVRFALKVAEASGGAFDPTVGSILAARGFNRNYRTGEVVGSQTNSSPALGYRGVRLDEERREITMLSQIGLDLGAVAKGLAVDLASRELLGYRGSLVDAGGDIFVRGESPDGGPWRVGIRHPCQAGELIEVVSVTDAAVCTSGGYERKAASGGGHHIVTPQTGASPDSASSVTIVATTTMLADAVATAAFVLGPIDGLAFILDEGVEGLIVTQALEKIETAGFRRYRP